MVSWRFTTHTNIHGVLIRTISQENLQARQSFVETHFQMEQNNVNVSGLEGHIVFSEVAL